MRNRPTEPGAAPPSRGSVPTQPGPAGTPQPGAAASGARMHGAQHAPQSLRNEPSPPRPAARIITGTGWERNRAFLLRYGCIHSSLKTQIASLRRVRANDKNPHEYFSRPPAFP